MTAPAHGPYTTTKHAIVGLSKGLRVELAMKGAPIGVTLVCPGMVSTNIMTQLETTGPGGRPRDGIDLPPEVDALWKEIGAVTEAGIPAADVGPMVSEAILAGRFWLLPNAEQFHAVFDRELEELKAGR
jgi:NAD(P)-dependent dehydrogenase (short-subunit alcohol dehydrogenase family)